MKKSGQVTLFIVLAIIIIVIVVIALSFRSDVTESKAETVLEEKDVMSFDAQEISDELQGCLEETLKDGIILMGVQGGYVTFPMEMKVFDGGNYSIPYLQEQNINLVPQKEFMERQLESYVLTFFPACFDPLNYPKLRFMQGAAKPDVSIEAEKVSAVVDYSLNILQGDSRFMVDGPYEAEMMVPFGKARDAAEMIIDKQIREGSIDIEYLLDTGMQMEILTLDDDELVYVMTDDQTLIRENPYTYIFATRIS